jgi:hypothetical protein
MQTISIKSGTSARVSISPNIGGVEATAEQLSGMVIYVFFVYQFTNKVYGTPIQLTAGSDYATTKRLTFSLTPKQTVEMLGNASDNQRFEIQFAVKTKDGDIIAEGTDSSVTINIVRWEAGKWLQEKSATSA